MEYYSFFDIDPRALPAGKNKYYFNVLVKLIPLRTGDLTHPTIKGIKNIWFLEHITDPRPWIAYFYIDDNEEPRVFEQPHAVVEVRDNGEVSWMNMLNWTPADRWGLNYEIDDDDEEGFSGYEPSY